MRIIYIVHGTYNSAGMERILSIKANYLVEKFGHEVTIITTDQRKRESYYKMSDKVISYDLSINFDFYYEYPMLKRIFSFYYKQMKCRYRLTNLLFELEADVVVSLMSRNISYLHKIKDGSRKVFELHFSRNAREQMLEGTNAGLFKKIAYRFRALTELKHIKKMDSFVVLTNEDSLLWGHLPNLSVIPNATSFFPDAQAKLVNKIVVSVGRIEPQKGYDQLVDIWKPVDEKHPDWKLIIFGDGKDLEALKAQISQADLQEKILLKPPTSSIDVELLNSSIYLMTSRYEGFPMVLIEAMACGLPVISFRCPCGPSDIINDKNDGFIIDIGDKVSMAMHLNKLIENDDLRKNMGHKARENIKRFSQDQVMDIWNSLFNQLMLKK